MAEELLYCRVCGGKVSSEASVCPHCGSPNFKPDSYIQRAQEEEKRFKKELERKVLREKGPELSVHAIGFPSSDQNNYRYVDFDGRPFQKTYSRCQYSNDDDIPTHLRLTPGSHTVTYKNYKYKYAYTMSRAYDYVVSTKSFVVDENSQSITLYFKSQKPLFKAPYYIIESVVVK